MSGKYLIDKKIKELRNNLKLLKKNKAITLKELEKDMLKQWAILYGLQISVQIVIDIGNHILSSLRANNIDKYTDIFTRLEEQKIISAKFAKEMKKMVGLRNIVAHEYAKIDLRIVHDVLKNNLGDFEEFIKYMEKYIK